VLVVLGVVLFVLLVGYGSLGPGDYPSEEFHGPDPESYVGERVSVAGTVQATDPLRIEVTYGTDGRAEYVVTGLEVGAERGELLRVAGRLTGPRTVEAENGFTVPRSGLWYTWGISFLAGLWVIARILRHWGFDREAIALVPRTRFGHTGESQTPGGSGGRTAEGGDGNA